MLRPLLDYIIIKEDKKEENTSSGGIILTDLSPKSGFKNGKILAVNKNSELKVGKRVMFKDWAGFEVFDKKEKVLIVAEEDVLLEMEDK
jgi:chaperonin GroES